MEYTQAAEIADPVKAWRGKGTFAVNEVVRKGEQVMGRNVVIIGGGAAGPSTAAEAKRRDPSLGITIIEAGAYVSSAS